MDYFQALIIIGKFNNRNLWSSIQFMHKFPPWVGADPPFSDPPPPVVSSKILFAIMSPSGNPLNILCSVDHVKIQMIMFTFKVISDTLTRRVVWMHSSRQLCVSYFGSSVTATNVPTYLTWAVSGASETALRQALVRTLGTCNPYMLFLHVNIIMLL